MSKYFLDIYSVGQSDCVTLVADSTNTIDKAIGDIESNRNVTIHDSYPPYDYTTTVVAAHVFKWVKRVKA